MKHIQNNQKSMGKFISANGFEKSQERSENQKSQDFRQMLVISKKKTLGYGFKHL